MLSPHVRRFWSNGKTDLYHADARDLPLPDKSAHMCLTSPPYWSLREYGLGSDGIGNEDSFDDHVDNVVDVFREIRRVLRDDGTAWLNYGDAYVNSSGTVHRPEGTKIGGRRRRDAPNIDLAVKQLIGMPWRVAFALQSDGWYLRSAIVWHKTNAMPAGNIQDRPTNSYEMLFLLSKKARYFYDAVAIEEPAKSTRWPGIGPQHGKARRRGEAYEKMKVNKTRNARDVWSIPTQPKPHAHFATMPDELARRCILAGTSAKGVCVRCAAPWKREDDSWSPTCGCREMEVVPATILDPFVGSGTTCSVSQSLGRRSVGIDLNVDYLKMAKTSVEATPQPMMLV